MPEIELVLLAAGASSRMGSPKPLLPWGQSTLLKIEFKPFKNKPTNYDSFRINGRANYSPNKRQEDKNPVKP